MLLLVCPDYGACLAELGAAHAQTVAQAGVRNYVVVAIDAQLRDHLMARGINVYFKDIQVGRPRLRCQHCVARVLRLHLLFAIGTLPGIAEQPSSLSRQSRKCQHTSLACAGGAKQGAVA